MLLFFTCLAVFCKIQECPALISNVQLTGRVATGVCKSLQLFQDNGLLPGKVTKPPDEINKNSCLYGFYLRGSSKDVTGKIILTCVPNGIGPPSPGKGENAGGIRPGSNTSNSEGSTGDYLGCGNANFHVKSSSKAKNVSLTGKPIDDQIKQAVSEAVLQIREYFTSNADSYKYLDKFTADLQETWQIFNDLSIFAKIPQDELTPDNVAAELGRIVWENNIRGALVPLQTINMLAVRMREDSLTGDPNKWLIAIRTSLAFFRQFKMFYFLLADIESKLSSFEAQTSKTLYNVQDINDWGLPNKPQGIYIEASTFDAFIEKVQETFELVIRSDFADLKSDKNWGNILAQLNIVLTRTLNTPAICTERDEAVFVEGPFVVASQALEQLKNCGGRNAKTIAINAAFLFIIDADIKSKEISTVSNVKILLMSSKFVVAGGHLIQVNYNSKPKLVPRPPKGTIATLFSGNLALVGEVGGSKLSITVDSKTIELEGNDQIPALTIENESVCNRITAFKRIALNSTNILSARKFTNFILKLDALDTMTLLYDAVSIYNELEMLSFVFRQLNTTIDFRPYLQSLLNRITFLARKEKGITEVKKTLAHVYAAVQTISASLQKFDNPTLVLDLTSYLKDQAIIIEGLKKKQDHERRLKLIQDTTKEYNQNLDNKINQSLEQIKTVLAPAIAETQQNLVKNMQNLEAAIQREIDDGKQNITYYEELKTEIKNHRIGWLHSIFNYIFEGFCYVMGYFSKSLILILAQSVLYGLESGATLAEEKFKLPEETVAENLAQIAKFESQTKEMVAEYKVYVQKMVNKLEECGADCKKAKSVVLDSKKQIDAFVVQTQVGENTLSNLLAAYINNNNASHLIHTLDYQLFKAFDQDQTQAMGASRTNYPPRAYTACTWHFSTGYDCTDRDLEMMREINKILESWYAEMYRLYTLKSNLQKIIVPLAVDMFEFAIKIMETLPSQSGALLDVSKWKIRKSLRNVKVSVLKVYSESFYENSAEIAQSIDDLGDTLSTIITIYEQIEHYRELQASATYISKISSAQYVDVGVTDPKLQAVLASTEIIMLAHLLLGRHNVFLQSFRMWVFPFAELYMEAFKPPAEVFYIGKADLKEMIEDFHSQVQALVLRLNDYKNTVSPVDNYVYKVSFDPKCKNPALYSWKNDEYGDIMAKFLSGDKVYLESFVQNSPDGLDAIKFQDILIRVEHKNSDANINKAIQKALEYFSLSLVVSDFTNYRFKGKSYPLPLPKINIIRSYAVKDDGLPSKTNIAYEKLLSGEFMLSPYTLWEMQLIRQFEETGDQKTDFQILEIYKNQINFVMVGNGQTYQSKDDKRELKMVDELYNFDFIKAF